MEVPVSSVDVNDVEHLCQLPPTAAPTMAPVTRRALELGATGAFSQSSIRSDMMSAERQLILGPRDFISFSVTTELPGQRNNFAGAYRNPSF
jgi:hypothetical protein